MPDPMLVPWYSFEFKVLRFFFGLLVPILGRTRLASQYCGDYSRIDALWYRGTETNGDALPLFCYARTNRYILFENNVKRDDYRWWFRRDQLTQTVHEHSWAAVHSECINDQTRIQSRENKLPHSYGVGLDRLQLIYRADVSVSTVLMWILCPRLQRRIFVSTNHTVGCVLLKLG
jgi:hypothetical protein